MKKKALEIIKQDVIKAFKKYYKRHPNNNYYDPSYNKDWRDVVHRNVVVYDWNNVPCPLKIIYLFACEYACQRTRTAIKYVFTADFKTVEAERELGKFYRTGTIIPAKYFEIKLPTKKPAFGIPEQKNIEIDASKIKEANSKIMVQFLKILKNQNELLIKINSNIDEMIKLVEKIGK